MATFAELRDRLSPDVHKRGKQFERVCKWLLETDPRYANRLSKVWLWDDWPGRWGPDCGIDLVAEDRDGKIWAVQAKCYDADHSVTKADVDSFLSESVHKLIDHRLLIATTNGVGRNARRVIRQQNEVVPVSQLLLADLEAAPVVWPTSPDRLTGGKARKPFTPRPHQRTAINDVVKNLDRRGQMIMACGTGKTLAALWVSERLEAKRTLVLVPSLTLLSQTVSEWLANAKEPFAYLPVCSDETVSRGNDAAVMFTSDLEYPVTTDPDAITSFLRKRGRRVVFSTYQSSPQVAAAQAAGQVPGFDLVIADEAHRCAGKVSSVYGTVLDDEAIRAKKRLFMTATPRTYTARVQKKADDEGIEVASMDDEAVFGPVVHQLNFGEAIQKGLLSDYQVVVVGVDDGRYKQMVDRRRIVKADKNLETDAETLAKHIALAKAIHDYGLRRTITFHSRIKTASEFANMLPKVVSWMKTHEQPNVELVTDHVSGEMSTGERNRRLNRLRNIEPGQSGVLTNAQCLSEGIDVPTLDGVAFIDPRRSQVDIVQAVGRAIRLSPDKTLGTIVIPVFLADTDNPDAAMNQSAFEPVWSIVRALRSHDDALGEALDGIRTSMGRGGVGSLPPNIVLDIPKDVSADFVDAFKTRVVETTTSTWNFNFGLLQQFASREGHARVMKDHREAFAGGEFGLGGWVGKQRSDYRVDALPADRVGTLEAVSGWTWDPFEDDFQEGLRALKQFASREGHARVMKDHREAFAGGEFGLGGWVGKQRSDYRVDALPADRVGTLEAVSGWTWDPFEDDFQEGLRALKQFADREGHARVSREHREAIDGEDFRLATWMTARRRQFRQGTLSADRVAALEAVSGWTWDPYEVDFQEHLRALQQFVDREGHTRISRDYREAYAGEDFALSGWMLARRSEHRRGKLSADRVAALEDIPGWVWNPVEADYQLHIRAINQFVIREGHARVTRNHIEQVDGKAVQLGRWARHHTNQFNAGELSLDRIAFFEGLPRWTWNPFQTAFDEGLAALQQFVEREGHSRPSDKFIEVLDGEEVKLGIWVGGRRVDYGRGKLSAERVSALEALPGWEWDAAEFEYQRWFSALRQFADREGHTRVHRDHEEKFDGELLPIGSWVTTRRFGYRNGRLSAERVAALEALPGWEWDPNEADLQGWLSALKQFAEREGHITVPIGHEESFGGEDYNLSTWIRGHRSKYRRGKLSAERVAALEALPGWNWDPHEANFQNKLGALKQFANREGHLRIPGGHRELWNGEEVLLHSWCYNLRNIRRAGKISPERIAALEAVPGWEWSAG